MKKLFMGLCVALLVTSTSYAISEEVVEKIEKEELTIEELAELTILGEFGNGQERKDNFEKMGLDYDKVQARVNEIIFGYTPKGVAKTESIKTNNVPKKEVRMVNPSASSATYSLMDLQFHGVINWSGYKFTYYSESVLPGNGLNIPGRHVNASGYVVDGDGYIVLASSSSIARGTVINTPFGAAGKVYDRCASCTPNWFDVYTK